MLRGQWLPLQNETSNPWIFLGSPWLTHPKQISALGLKLKDFALHDPAIDLLHLLQMTEQSLHDAHEIAEELSRQTIQLKQANAKLSTQYEALEHAEALKHNILETAAEGIASTDKNGKIMIVNSAIEQIFGYSKDELSAQHLSLLFPHFDNDTDADAFMEVLYARKHADAPIELMGHKKNGELFPCELSLGRVELGETQIYTSVIRNVTERKQAEEALRVRTEQLSHANARLDRASKMKDDFLASISHELRTPLNTILGMSEAFLEGVYGPPNEAQKESLQYIEESGRHLLALINDILDLSKISAGKVELEYEKVDLFDLCQSCMRIIRKGATNKSLQVNFTDEGVTAPLWADARRLKQVLINLLSNATKFTPKGGRIGLRVKMTPDQQQVTFTVWDEGIGISKENQTRIFQPFIQIDSKLSRQYEGTGLGLSLVQHMVKLHNGTLSVESQIGQGSQFHITLPNIAPKQTPARPIIKSLPRVMAPPPPRETPPPPSTKPIKKKTMPYELTSERKKILLAEDNESSIMLFSRFLEAKQYDVTLARNGIEALQHAREDSFDIILMDIQMPKMDGLETIGNLREFQGYAHTPIVALTALAMPEDKERCLQAGADDYLSKPLNLQQLISTIEKHLQKRSHS